MELVLISISVISLALNVLIYGKVRNFISSSVQELPVNFIEPEEREAEVGEVLPPVEPVITVPMVEEVYQGWRNKKNIPLSEAVSPPQQTRQIQVRGPLERPDGFV